MNQKFPKFSRLLNAKEFGPVFKKPDFRVSNRYFLFLVLNAEKKECKDQPSSRLGIVIAKKNIAKAVQRNRIKRIVREIFRIKHNKIAKIDLVILARKGLDTLENYEIHKQLEELYQEIAIKSKNFQV